MFTLILNITYPGTDQQGFLKRISFLLLHKCFTDQFKPPHSRFFRTFPVIVICHSLIMRFSPFSYSGSSDTDFTIFSDPEKLKPAVLLQYSPHDNLFSLSRRFNKSCFLIKPERALIIKFITFIRKLRIPFNSRISFCFCIPADSVNKS